MYGMSSQVQFKRFLLDFSIMDIAITLTKDLWSKIVSGEKKVEMRKWDLPKHFGLKQDSIYVVLKGTRKIVGRFKVEDVRMSFIQEAAWRRFGDGLGVSYQWYTQYWGKSIVMYFFVIGNCRVLSCHKNIEVTHAPQKYINIDKAWKCLVHL